MKNGGSVDELLANSPKLGHNDSWYEKVDSIIILDKGHDAEVLLLAAEKALGSNAPNTTRANNSTCVPVFAIAARGAALRARDWIDYYEASNPLSGQDEGYENGSEEDMDEL